MYDKINITENHLQILSLFTDGYEYYIREVQRLLKISPRTAQLILKDLESKAVLESTTRGKIRLYKLKNTSVARRYLTLTEQYKAISFTEKHPMVKEIIAKITPFIEGIGIIFGSYAKYTQKKDSDLDIFIAGKCNLNEIKKISKLYNIKINPIIYPLKIFEKNIKNDVLIKEIKHHHIIFLNIELFLKIQYEQD